MFITLLFSNYLRYFVLTGSFILYFVAMIFIFRVLNISIFSIKSLIINLIAIVIMLSTFIYYNYSKTEDHTEEAIIALSKGIEKLGGTKKELEEFKESAQKTVDKAEKGVKQLKEQIVKNNLDITKYEQQLDCLEDEIYELKETLKQIDDEIQQRKRKIFLLEKEYALNEKELEEIEEKLKNKDIKNEQRILLTARKNYLMTRQKEIETEITTLKREISGLEQQEKDIQEQIELKSKQFKFISKYVDTLKENAAALSSIVENREKQIEQLKQTIQKIDAKINEIEQTITVYQNLKNSFGQNLARNRELDQKNTTNSTFRYVTKQISSGVQTWLTGGFISKTSKTNQFRLTKGAFGFQTILETALNLKEVFEPKPDKPLPLSQTDIETLKTNINETLTYFEDEKAKLITKGEKQQKEIENFQNPTLILETMNSRAHQVFQMIEKGDDVVNGKLNELHAEKTKRVEVSTKLHNSQQKLKNLELESEFNPKQRGYATRLLKNPKCKKPLTDFKKLIKNNLQKQYKKSTQELS